MGPTQTIDYRLLHQVYFQVVNLYLNVFFFLFQIEFDNIYTRLDVTLIERGESFYQDMMPGVVAELERIGKSCLEHPCACCYFRQVLTSTHCLGTV